MIFQFQRMQILKTKVIHNSKGIKWVFHSFIHIIHNHIYSRIKIRVRFRPEWVSIII